jgi:hypothetical protein
MGRKIKFSEKEAYLSVSKLSLKYLKVANQINQTNEKISNTTLVAIILGLLGALFIAFLGFFSYTRFKRPSYNKSFDDKHRARMEIELKEFTVEF